jgi:hypothetical protein
MYPAALMRISGFEIYFFDIGNVYTSLVKWFNDFLYTFLCKRIDY